ncbi:MAG: PP2C family protein-serine/threonine phosphatase [candidate division KSB1 bacterium]|nr:PP2C family protein-serine/threonine phosphatase [candidate division KSB1 bacterium]MDZ7272602.1 PP2C family protein-serine/threonine phosphatase [candidate division KSB1 bacterium]MDZ7284375.1 PP2C family protein-serine/threonine phosphatase [candidate division KSB1 bacterium]MDZ7297229.1 PP2C family protein-serine/threonine phosphatase [candidate division KSB1 bacterium]MDZ7308544.1 PP2C family protein-serine/threonine phosphatase [candidate division KSB1 bacterium]
MLASLWLWADLPVADFLRPAVSIDDVLVRAEQAFQQSPLAGLALHRSINVATNPELARYVQQAGLPQAAASSLALGRWEILRQGSVPSGDNKKDRALFRVNYDFTGRFIGTELRDPRRRDLPGASQEQALSQAKTYLAALAFDTTAFALSEKKTAEDEGVLTHEFTFLRPVALAAALQERVQVRVAGNTVVFFNHETIVPETKQPAVAPRQGSVRFSAEPDAFSEGRLEKIADITVGVLIGITWTLVLGFLIVTFFKRLRHDEIEFKRAWWFGGLLFLATAVSVAVPNWQIDWLAVFLGGGMSGLFVGLSIAMVYATADGVSRDVRPEKLAVLDLLFTGHLRVRELGEAILRSFFIAGTIALLLAAPVWLACLWRLSYVHVEQNLVWFLGGPAAMLAVVSKNVTAAAYHAVIFFLFWPAYLESRLRRHGPVLALLALSFALAGFSLNYLRPLYFNPVLMLPAAFLLARFALRHDFFTLLLALFLFGLVLDLSFIGILPPARTGTGPVVWTVLAVLLLTTGALLIYQPRSVQDFRGYVPAYVSRIAERARFLKELEIAHSVQLRFLPQVAPDFPNLEIASICRPAKEVGGDYFDFIRSGPGRLSVVVGDVSGKGVSAAFYMTLAKGIIQALARQSHSPKSLLCDMNTVFYENTPKEIFISLIYGCFDLAARTLTFARAGHNPLILHKGLGGEVQLLHPGGLAIGLERGEVFAATIEEQRLSIQRGDVFVFYTDGISEAMNAEGEEFGEERLRQVISRLGQTSAQQMLDAITREVFDFISDAPPHDDFTLVVVKVVG